MSIKQAKSKTILLNTRRNDAEIAHRLGLFSPIDSPSK
jgi:hypothetical protein